MSKIAFLGLGVMGYPMAAHLKASGHNVTVYNRTTDKAKKWVEAYGGQFANTVIDAVKDQDVVLSCVGNDDDLRDITIGKNGAFSSMKEGAVFIDHTTTSAQVARELDAIAHTKNIGFIDAPVSGGQAGAENGKLTIMCGGNETVFKTIEHIISVYAVSVRLLGSCGSGQLCKMVNQICLAGVVQGLSEGLAFGQKAGLDMFAVIEVISQGAAGSWQMDHRGKNMLNDKFDYGFAVDLMRKDLNICLNEAKSNGSVLPIIALIDQFYGDLQRLHGGRLDTSSLIKRLK